jgi:hypothetical protein
VLAMSDQRHALSQVFQQLTSGLECSSNGQKRKNPDFSGLFQKVSLAPNLT